MIDLKVFAGRVAVAGALSLMPLALGAGIAHATPSPVAPPGQPTDQGDANAPGWVPPSPYAGYGGRSICANPGLYFVNICA